MCFVVPLTCQVIRILPVSCLRKLPKFASTTWLLQSRIWWTPTCKEWSPDVQVKQDFNLLLLTCVILSFDAWILSNLCGGQNMPAGNGALDIALNSQRHSYRQGLKKVRGRGVMRPKFRLLQAVRVTKWHLSPNNFLFQCTPKCHEFDIPTWSFLFLSFFFFFEKEHDVFFLSFFFLFWKGTWWVAMLRCYAVIRV